MKNNKKKNRKFVVFSGVSGSLSFLGGWQVCHNLCLGVIAFLSLVGISVAGMPLLFLTQYAPYFWSLAIVLLIPTLFMYFRNRQCMSKSLILFNVGIIVFSFPFFQEISLAFWSIGAIIIIYTIISFAKNKIEKKKLFIHTHKFAATAKPTVAFWTLVRAFCRNQFAIAYFAFVKSSSFNNHTFTSKYIKIKYNKNQAVSIW